MKLSTFVNVGVVLAIATVIACGGSGGGTKRKIEIAGKLRVENMDAQVEYNGAFSADVELSDATVTDLSGSGITKARIIVYKDRNGNGKYDEGTDTSLNDTEYDGPPAKSATVSGGSFTVNSSGGDIRTQISGENGNGATFSNDRIIIER